MRPDNIRHAHFSRNPKIAQYLKAYKYVKEFGEGIDRICNELETKGCAIPSFHVDAFILKATLMAEWTSEKDFDHPSTVQENGTANAQNLSVALGISLRTTKRDLYVLRDMNLIHYVGSDKTGHWEVIKESD